MDTSTPAKIAKPEQIYYSLKKNIDTAARFEKHSLLETTIKSDLINKRNLEVAIPQGTTSSQWAQINQAIEYGTSKNIDVKVTITK